MPASMPPDRSAMSAARKGDSDEPPMDWVLDALRALREVRDWSVQRVRRDESAMLTRSVLAKATQQAEQAAARLGSLESKSEHLHSSLESLEPKSEHLRSSPEPRSKHLRSALEPRSEHLGSSLEPRSEHSGSSLGPRRPLAVAPEIRPSITPSDIDPHALAAIKRLRKYEYKAYVVGGCIRDLLLGIEPKDFDVVTNARPEEIKSIFKNARIIGRRFRLVHLYYHGGKVIEVATFRAHIPPVEEDGADLLIKRDNVFGNEQEDAQRRDFTVNGLFYDPLSGEILDYVDGLNDIQQGIVRMIGDPDIRLREDPVRILRAIRFNAKTDLRLDPALESSLNRHVEDLLKCPPARLLEELLKILRTGHALRSFQLLIKHGVVRALLPEIQAYLEDNFAMLIGYNKPHGARAPSEQIYAHLSELDRIIAREPTNDEVMIAALIHPIVTDILIHADQQGKDKNKRINDLFTQIGSQIQFTRRLSEILKQIFNLQRHLESGQKNRRRRRMSPMSLMTKPYFLSALRVFELHKRATNQSLDDVYLWEKRAKEAGIKLYQEQGDNRGFFSPQENQHRRKRKRKKNKRPSNSSNNLPNHITHGHLLD